jgi:hypothetical protein
MTMHSRKQLERLGEPFGDSCTRIEGCKRIYGGGGGSSGGSGTSTTVQNIPDELKPLATAYTQKAIGLSNQPFVPYTEQRYADLTPYQNLGLGMTANRALSGSQTMNNAELNLNQMMGGGSNPYLDAMVNRAQQNVIQNANQAAVGSGSFGHSGINEAATRQMGDIAAAMYGGAYAQDQANRLQAMGMAPTFANQAYTDALQLFRAGQSLQDQAQQARDFSFEQFQEAQNLPYKQLAAMSGVFNSGGLGGSSTTTSSQSGGGGK